MVYRHKRRYAVRRRTRRFGRSSFGRRRFHRRSSRTASWTVQRGRTSGLRYKSRRISRRTWKNILWRDSLAQNHYRSLAAIPNTLQTGTVQGQGPLNAEVCFSQVPTPPTLIGFWEPTGGLLPTDLGVSVPGTFNGDLTFRGGKQGFTMSVSGAITQLIGVHVWVVKLIKHPIWQTALPALANWGFDPTMIPDWSRNVGTLVDSRTFILDPTCRSGFYERKFPIQKYDQGVFHQDNLGGGGYLLISHVCNLSDTTDVGVDVLTTYNCSFSGDAA